MQAPRQSRLVLYSLTGLLAIDLLAAIALVLDQWLEVAGVQSWLLAALPVLLLLPVLSALAQAAMAANGSTASRTRESKSRSRDNPENHLTSQHQGPRHAHP